LPIALLLEIIDEKDLDLGQLNHVYGYVDQSPLIYTDPDGLAKLPIQYTRCVL